METAIFQFVPQGLDFFLDPAARQREAQIAQARVEQALVGPARPRPSRRAPGGGLAARLAGFGFAGGDVRLLEYISD
ncbi:MAG: hypothetical protein ACYC9K_13290 [Sulfuricaulis sp.]